MEITRRNAIKAVGVGATSLCLGNYSFAKETLAPINKTTIENCWAFIDPNTNRQRFIEILPITFDHTDEEAQQFCIQMFRAKTPEVLVHYSQIKDTLHIACQRESEYFNLVSNMLFEGKDQLLIKIQHKNSKHAEIKKYTLTGFKFENFEFLNMFSRPFIDIALHLQLGLKKI